MTNWELLQQEKSKYKDTLVLDFLEVVLFKDVIDWDDDYYYVYEKLDWETYESSCCVWFTPLVELKNRKDYDRLEYWWRLNSQNPNTRFSNNDILKKKIDKNTIWVFYANLVDSEFIDDISWEIMYNLSRKEKNNYTIFISNQNKENQKIIELSDKLRELKTKFKIVYDQKELIIQNYYLKY